MDRYKSSGNKETMSSGYKGPRGSSVTRISIIPIKICAQNLDEKIQLQSYPAQAFTLDLITGICENRCSLAKLILSMSISSFSFYFF